MACTQIWGQNRTENFFRRTINFDTLPQDAVARIYVDTGYELFINGQPVTRVNEWCNMRDYDVLGFLHEGENLIAVHGFNYSGHRAFAFELACDGKSVLTSDTTWKAFPEELWGWMLPEFDDSKWDSATEMDMSCAGAPQWNTLPGSDPKKIVPILDGSPFFKNEIPKWVNSPFFRNKRENFVPSKELGEIAGENYVAFASAPLPETLDAQSLLYAKDCTINDSSVQINETGRYTGPQFVVDFGCEVVGYLRMRIQSEKEVTVRIFYGENIDQAMSEPSRDQLLHKMLVEEYRLRGGTQEFESRTRVGFRFARVEFFDSSAPIKIDGFSLRTALYQTPFKGYFECNDEWLNRIWMAGQKTLHLCMQEYYIDAIMRDRFLWVGDTRNEALYNYYLFADTDLFEFCWDDMAKCQYPDGSIPSAYGVGMSLIWDYVAWYIIAFRDYYQHTGKKEFLLKHKDSIEQATDFLISKATDDGLINVPENPIKAWMVVLNNETGKDPFMNMVYLQSLETALLVAELAGDEEKQKKYSSYTADVAQKVEKLLKESPLASLPRNMGSSLMMTEIVNQEFRNGDPESAMKMIHKYWKPMLTSGADTLFEGFYCMDKEYPKITEPSGNPNPPFTSNCHGWTGGATLLLMSEVAGIRPVTPGFERFSVTPKPCGLTQIRTVVPTPHGEIALNLSIDAATCTLLVPQGTTAEFEYGTIKQDYPAGLHEISLG